MNAPSSIYPPSLSREFWTGARSSVPAVISSMPFGLLFGALAVQNGMSIWEALLMSLTVYGGASQMVGIELFGQRIAPWLIVLSIVIINSRHVLYSAAIGRIIGHWNGLQKAIGFQFLVDPQYAESERRFETGHTVTFAWYMGLAFPVMFFWLLDTALGALFGKLIPDINSLGLGFTIPVYFMTLVISFRRRTYWLPVVAVSALASIIAFKLLGPPWHVLAGAALGILLAVCLPTPKPERRA